ncbi:MAG: response regulator transcription factor [Dechloromonas sp.]|nr:response regulator transcription factor [Dechloromonas sp.]
MKTLRIVLADDQLLIRAGIRALLESMPGYVVLAECENGQQAILAVRQYRPDVILLDIAMPGQSGLEVARALLAEDPSTRILILSSIDRPEVVREAMMIGVNGYLLKDFVLMELQQAIAAVMAGQVFMSARLERLGGQAEMRASDKRLTQRQLEILRLVAFGRTTKEIARQLEISPKTVEFHRSRLMERIGVRDVTGLVRYALQSGVLS